MKFVLDKTILTRLNKQELFVTEVLLLSNQNTEKTRMITSIKAKL